MNVDTAKLRQFINEHFGPQDLNDLLFDYFRSVHEDLTPGMTKQQQISLLLEFCHRHNQMQNLLAAVSQMRPFFQPNDYVPGEKAPTAAPQPPAPITRNPRQIFISHAHQDTEVAQQLAHDLAAHGYDIWIAPDSIQPGEKWVEAINRGLEESGLFVLLLSPDAVASRWVQIETNAAISLNRQDEMELYPLMLKTCRPPILWQAFQNISLIGNYDAGCNELFVALNQNELGFLTDKDNQTGSKAEDTKGEEDPDQDVSEFVIRIREAVQKNLKKDAQPEVNIDSWIHPKTGIEMVRVSAGEFLYGDDKKRMHLDEFWIAKTPVTNAEYKRFLDANPKVDVPFNGSVGAKPFSWDRQRCTFPEGKADHPVVLVSWHDAKAYAEWAGMELPTVEQWQKAARGTDGREFPWGDEWRENHCNTSKTGFWETTPVGQFSPQGNSPYGCVDMAGNVTEWTSTSGSDPSQHVLCGVGFESDHNYARTYYHYDYKPYYPLIDTGFRVVVMRRSPSHTDH